MQLSPQVIDQILERASIVDIVSEYVELEKKGKNYVGLCPFHGDTNPSMSVSEEKKIFKCFSCGAGGNAIKFVQDYEKISFVEAAKKVASRVGIEIEVKESRFKKYHNINKEASDFYSFYLQNTPDGKSVRSYLQGRGISEQTIKQFEIGFAPEGNLLYKSLRQKQVEPLDIITTGLAHKNQDHYYDTFRKRVMFPIWDSSGNIVGFSGRTIENTDQAKYVNSRESSLFKKGEILYNFHKALQPIKNKGRIVLMEGFMDVIAAFNAGVEEAVATMGTALTLNHINLIKRVTNKVVICFDGDNAGQDAAYRSLNNLRGLDVRVVKLPEGLDPDDYIKNNSNEDFVKLVDNAVDMLDFIFDYNLKKVNRSNIHEIEQFKKAIFKLIERSSNVQIELYLNRLSQELSVSYDSIKRDFDTRNAQRTNVQVKKVAKPKYKRAENTLISIMLTNKNKAIILNKQLESKYVDSTNEKIINLLIKTYYRQYAQFDSEKFLEMLSMDLRNYFIQEQFIEKTYFTDKEVDDCVKTIEEYQVVKKLEFIKEEISKAQGQEKLDLQLQMLAIEKQLKGARNNE